MADLTAYICNKTRSEYTFDFFTHGGHSVKETNVCSPFYVSVKMHCTPKQTKNRIQQNSIYFAYYPSWNEIIKL